MNRFPLKALAIAIGLSFAGVGASNAQMLLNFEMNGGGTSNPAGDQTYSGAAAIGQAGNLWNHLTLSNIDFLTPTTGFTYANGTAATGISITNVHNFDLTGATGGEGSGNALLRSYMGATPNVPQSTPSTLTLSGFLPGSKYNLYVIASSDHQSVGGIFSVNGSATQTLNGATGTNFTLGIDTLLFPVTADSSGNINISETATTIQYRVLNGLQLQAVPEPSTYAMMVGGLIFVGYVLRRKKRALAAS